MPEVRPYGSWPSPIGAAEVARLDGRPGWISVAAGSTWWVAPRPEEAGRVALVRSTAGATEVILPAPWSVRSRVHEYGGRAYVVVEAADGRADVVFSEYSDQRLYRLRVGSHEPPQPITPAPDIPSGLRYIEPFVGPGFEGPGGGDEVWCIREEHTGPAPTDLTRAIVAVPLDGSAATDPERVRVVVRDTHFLACPRVSPNGRRLSWIGWEHPLMPWDETRLRVADLDESRVAGEPTTVAGGADESIVQAEWADDETLLYVGDATGWWNLYRRRIGATTDLVNLTPREEEFGTALWQLGAQWFAPLPDGDIAVIHGTASTALGIVSATTGELRDVPAPGLTEWAATLAVDTSQPGGPTVIGVAAGPHRHYEISVVSTTKDAHRTSLINTVSIDTGDHPVDETFLPEPVARTFVAADGREVHASLYPPRHPSVVGPDDELPPYLVYVHGGPTSRAVMVYDLEIAYFTSRGIGAVEVNYGGSTGFGREYRNRLRENWGVVDVEDSVAVAQALVDEGLADPSRLAIRGGSAGGWTSAAALTFTDVFDAATIMYPIIDLAGWRTGETHDFESQYLDSLVGPWPVTEERYRERSPVNFPERVNAPFLMLQGLEDEVCPPAQAQRFVEAVAERGVPHAYLTFEGEQHGFRRAETIVAALEAELSMYGQVFGFEPAGVSQPLVIEGLEARR